MQFSIPVILAMLQAAIEIAPQILTTIDQLKDIGAKLFATLNGREPTQAEQDELQAQIDADFAEAMKPLPPE
jgi:hypothetical protein